MTYFTRLLSPLILLLCALSLSTAFAASTPAAITPFVVTLNVEKFGMKLGVTRLEMTQPMEGHYRFVLTTKTSGLVRWFVRDEVVEISEGILRADAVIPLSYEYSQTGGKKEEILKTEFDWESGRAITTGTSGRVEHEIVEGTVDRLSIYLAVMTRLKNNSKELTLSMIDKTKLYDYSLEPMGLEKLDTPTGPITTLVLKRANDKPNRDTRIWMAPSFDYLPVRICQESKGSKDFEMTLAKVEGFSSPDSP